MSHPDSTLIVKLQALHATALQIEALFQTTFIRDH